MGQGVCLDVDVLKTSENAIFVKLPSTSYSWSVALPPVNKSDKIENLLTTSSSQVFHSEQTLFKEGEHVTISLRPEHIKIHSQIYDNDRKLLCMSCG